MFLNLSSSECSVKSCYRDGLNRIESSGGETAHEVVEFPVEIVDERMGPQRTRGSREERLHDCNRFLRFVSPSRKRRTASIRPRFQGRLK